MKYKSRLYYGTQLVEESDRPISMDQYLHTNWGLEIYNGGYISTYLSATNRYEWFRCDYTPVLPEDVPKELIVLDLILR